MANIFKSKYTGEQIEEKLDNSTKVVGNPDGSAVADLVKIQIGDYIYYLPYGSNVSANSDGEDGGALNSITINGVKYTVQSGTKVLGNPEGSAVADLTKIQIGDDIYYLPYGTDVSANPSTDATDELTKISIAGTTYSLPIGQSGGGGSVLFRHEITCIAGTLNLLTTSSSAYTDINDLFSEVILGAWIDERSAYLSPIFIYLESTDDIRTAAYTINSNGSISPIELGNFSSDYVTPIQSGGATLGGYDLDLNTTFGTITLKRIKYADGRAELNKTFTENTLLHNVVAVSFEAVSTAMAVSGAIITKSPYDEKVYCNTLGGDTYITTGNGFTNNTQIILVGKCTMEWSSN